ncbi:MAG: hypothetical protein J6A01_07905, partial [Proteobacteria bacterium]|nr:hypothetical protein [Pseudomonadota bacterium]
RYMHSRGHHTGAHGMVRRMRIAHSHTQAVLPVGQKARPKATLQKIDNNGTTVLLSFTWVTLSLPHGLHSIPHALGLY